MNGCQSEKVMERKILFISYCTGINSLSLVAASLVFLF